MRSPITRCYIALASLACLFALSGCGKADPCAGLELKVQVRPHAPDIWQQRFGIASTRKFDAELLYEVTNTLNEPRLFHLVITDPEYRADTSGPHRIAAKSVERFEGHQINTTSGRSHAELEQNGWRIRVTQCK